jgi:hypothetical protein
MAVPKSLHDIAISRHGGASEKRRPRTFTVTAFQSRATAHAFVRSL